MCDLHGNGQSRATAQAALQPLLLHRVPPNVCPRTAAAEGKPSTAVSIMQALDAHARGGVCVCLRRAVQQSRVCGVAQKSAGRTTARRATGGDARGAHSVRVCVTRSMAVDDALAAHEVPRRFACAQAAPVRSRSLRGLASSLGLSRQGSSSPRTTTARRADSDLGLRLLRGFAETRWSATPPWRPV